MKIAIPSDDGSTVADHFGRAAGFLIYDASPEGARKLEYRRNGDGRDDCDHRVDEHGHAGHHVLVVENLLDCEGVVTRSMGRHMYAVIARLGMEIRATSEKDADTAARLFFNEELRTDLPASCCAH